jgi:predicted phage terminase large subunit-like protein
MKFKGKDLERIDLERAMLPTSLGAFIKKAWHVTQSMEYVPNWHIECMAEHLEDMKEGRIKNLVINIPPACMKTLTCSVFFPVWEWLSRPASGFIVASYDATLTLRASRESLRLIQSKWFQDRWPIKLLGDAGTEYLTQGGGFRFNTSIQGKVTGRHATRAIIDDPLKPQTVSKITLDGCERWWRESLQTRFKNPQDRSVLIMMQRLHDRDLSAIAIQEGYQHLKLPMRWEPAAYSIPDRDQGWAMNAAQTYSKEGDLLWPARFSEDVLEPMERIMGSQATAAQHQQRPVPAGGLVFKSEWFQHWQPASLPPRFDKMCSSWDCSFKGTEDSDFVVGQVWGKYKADFYLLDQYRARANVSDTMRAILAMSLKWPRCTAKLVEDKANGPAVIDLLKKRLPGLIAVNPEGGKESRANAVSPLFEALNVWLPPDCKWVGEYKDELLAFPLGVNDDQVDATSQALVWLMARKSIHGAMEQVRKDGIEGWFAPGGGQGTPW